MGVINNVQHVIFQFSLKGTEKINILIFKFIQKRASFKARKSKEKVEADFFKVKFNTFPFKSQSIY